MIINAKKLNELGVTVRVYERIEGDEPRQVKLRDGFVEVFVEHGTTPQPVIDCVNDAIHTPEYRDALIPAIICKIQQFQILEAIDRTQD